MVENSLYEVFKINNSMAVGEHEDTSEGQRLDNIYDDETLGFKKDQLASTKRMQAQDPLEEIELGDGTIQN